jgi:hypothetical protein
MVARQVSAPAAGALAALSHDGRAARILCVALGDADQSIRLIVVEARASATGEAALEDLAKALAQGAASTSSAWGDIAVHGRPRDPTVEQKKCLPSSL